MIRVWLSFEDMDGAAPFTAFVVGQVLADVAAVRSAISDAEMAGRADMRGSRVFSIDPPTARDLDDALSVVPLPNGNLRIGVHIADVSHFVQ